MKNKQKTRLYLSPPHMSGEEMKYLRNAFDSNWIAPLGPHVDGFEKEFAELHSMQGTEAAAVVNGTAALHLILRILDVGPGDKVFCSDFTFFASVTPVVYQGAEPVFIDSELRSWNMDPDILERELKKAADRSELPKAVIVVHLYGQSADMDPILSVCEKYEVPVIEDAAEALGAKYRMSLVGTMGEASIFSFNGNKIITNSAGGMILSRDRNLISRSRFLATQARDPAPHYQHSEIGFNYRMSNLLAAVGRAQLKVLSSRIEKRREIFTAYQQRLADVPGIVFMPEPEWSRGNRWLTCITVDPDKFGADREDIRQALEKENIESRPLWKPMHLQPVFQNYQYAGGSIGEELFEKGLCLPSGTAMKDEDLERVCGVIRSVSFVT
ncbi:MAG: DegT/DnrJ/EryC1/StrS family aminotransferase [bacterium]